MSKKHTAPHILICKWKAAFGALPYSNIITVLLSLTTNRIPFLYKQFLTFSFHLHLTKHASAFGKNMHIGLQPWFLHQTSCQRRQEYHLFESYSYCSFPWKRYSETAWRLLKTRNRTGGFPAFHPKVALALRNFLAGSRGVWELNPSRGPSRWRKIPTLNGYDLSVRIAASPAFAWGPLPNTETYTHMHTHTTYKQLTHL